MDDVLSFPNLQQALRSVVSLPTETEMKYWDEHFTEIPKEIRNRNMSRAENKLNSYKMDPTFRKMYEGLPVDLQSCVPIMLSAKEDLDVLGMSLPDEMSA